MPAKRTWTVAEDALILANDRPFSVVARAVGCARWTVRERAKMLGIVAEPIRAPVPVVPTKDGDRHREPLPAMHPVSWRAVERALNDHRQGYGE